MSIVRNTTEYRWGDTFSKELRERLIHEIMESGDRDETLEQLQETSDSNLFLIWLRC